MATLLPVFAALSGCSEPVPAAKVPRSSVAPTTATSSPSPTKLTAEQEVEAAVRNYYAELTRASQTNDTSKLKTLMDKNCPCYRAVRVIEKGAQRGEKTSGFDLRLERVRVHDVVASSAAAKVTYNVSSHAVIDSAGNPVERFPAETGHVDLSLVNVSNKWIVTNELNLDSS